MSAVVAIGTLLIFIFCALEVVGIATNYWMTVDVTSGLVKSHAGLFKICVEVLTIEKCVYYIQYAKDFLNVHYIGSVGSSLLGCLLLCIASLVGICGCNKPNPKPTVQNLGGVGTIGGFFCSVGAGWYYLYFFKGTFGDISTVLVLFGIDVGPGWSFYLVAAAGGGSLLLSIVLMIIGCNMPTTNGAILPIQQPQTVIAMTGTNIQQGHNPPNTNAMQNPGYNDPYGQHPAYPQ